MLAAWFFSFSVRFCRHDDIKILYLFVFEEQTPTPMATLTPSVTLTPTATETPESSAAIKGARLTLGQALGVSVTVFQLEEVEYTEWNNSCLEMPADGEVCLPVLTPGFRIILSYSDKSYEAHTNLDGLQVRWAALP